MTRHDNPNGPCACGGWHSPSDPVQIELSTSTPVTGAELWDRRFMALAQQIATWSKDPSTKVGAVIVDAHRRIVSMGYNGFPRGVEDLPERLNDRAQKYPRIVHAEPNAILNATRSVKGCTLYVTPFAPCSECAKLIIQAGIKRVVISLSAAETSNRWADSTRIGWEMMDEARIDVGYIGQEYGPR